MQRHFMFLQTWMKSNMVRGRRSSKIAISLENLLRIAPTKERKRRSLKTSNP